MNEEIHSGCRVAEFVRWNRVMLEHEREHLSVLMSSRAFRQPAEVTAIMHELSDIDNLLSQLPKRVETP